MKFVCDKCQAKYQIADEKVAGRVVRMKCRRCGHDIRVTPDGADASQAGSASAVESTSTTSMSLSDVVLGDHASPGPAAKPASLFCATGPRPVGALAGSRPGTAPAPPAAVSAKPAPVGVPRPLGAPGAPHAAPRPAVSAARPLGALGAAPKPPSSVDAPKPLGAAPKPSEGAPKPLGTLGAPHAAARAAPRPLGAAKPPAASARPVSAPPTSLLGGLAAKPASVPPTRRATLDGSAPQASSPIAVTTGLRPAGPAKAPATTAEGDRSSRVAASAPRPVSALPSTAKAGPSSASALEHRPTTTRSPAAPAPPPPEPAPPAPPQASDLEWYVGIAGTPTGPMRAAAIREHALAGAVDGDSLAWREGLAEWRPLRTIPELQALVVAVHSARSAMPAIEEPAPAPPAPVVASAEAVFKPLADAPDTVRSEAVAAMAATEQPVPRAAALDQQRANAQAQADLEMVLGRKRSTHPMAYAFIAAAAVFGGVAAYVLLSKPQPQIVVVHAGPTVVVPSTSTAPAPATSEPDKAQVDVGDVSPAAPQVTVAKLGGARPKASATTTAGASAPIDTSGFMNIPGPVATPQPGPSQGASQLSQGEISAVVTQNQAIMKRKCWLPALEARPVNGATSARVDGRLVIGASGTVESASASGAERDFPGLASCIAARMKIWKFPPSSGSTPVNVPFVFAGQ